MLGSAVYKTHSALSGEKKMDFYLEATGLLGEFLLTLKENSVSPTRVSWRREREGCGIPVLWKYSVEILGVRIRSWV